MLKNKTQVLVGFNLILTLGLIILGAVTYQNTTKIATVNEQVLFEKFKMTSDMQRLGLEQLQKRQKHIDSLHTQLQTEGLSAQVKDRMMQELIAKRNELDLFNQQFSIEETQKIWQRIFNYSKEFSEKNNYTYLIGSSNKQTLLFATTQNDVTQDLLTYINSKYEGN